MSSAAHSSVVFCLEGIARAFSDLSEEYVDFNSAEYSAAIHAKRQKGFA
jgi:hypothetical protein